MEELEAKRVQAAQMVEDALNFGFRSAPPPSAPKPAKKTEVAAPSKRELARLKDDLSKAAKKKKPKKLKAGKREREEYATIEEDIEALEALAAKADAELEEAKSATKRLGQMEMLDLVMAASDARKAVDEKMERFLELEELLG